METAKEWEGDGPARSTTASEQISEGPQARDSENNDSFKEDTLDTLQQTLTCETGNTGTEASTPPCDKGAAGQGLHGTSPASDNLDKVKDAISLIQLEARDEVVEADSLEKQSELEVTSSDDSGAWETASEESIAFEEATDVKEEKQNENLDSNGNMDINGQKETEDHLKIQKPSEHLEKTGSGGTGKLAEEIEQCCEDLPSEQTTDGARPADTEYLCNISKTGSEELPPHADEAFREGTVSEVSDPNVEHMLSEESLSHFANTEPQIEKLNESVEEPGTGGPHVGKSGLHDEEAVSELTGSHEENGSQNEEGVNKDIKTQMEEPGIGGTHVGKSGLHDEEAVSELTGSHEDSGSQNEEGVNKDIKTQMEEPGIGGTHVGKSGLHDEEAVSKWTESDEEKGSQDEEAANKGIEIPIEETPNKNIELQQTESASEQTEPQVSEAVCEMREPHVDKTVPHTEERVQECRGSPVEVQDSGSTVPDSNETETSVVEILSEQCSHPMEEAVSDGTHNEEIVNDLSKSHVEQSAIEVTMSPADTSKPSVEETLIGDPGPYNEKSDCEDTVTHDGACANDETGTCVDERVSEGALHEAGDNGIGESGTPTVDTIGEEAKSMSDHALSIERKEKCIMNVIQENDNSGHFTEQGPLGTSTSKEDIDCKTEMVNNEEVVGTQSISIKGSGADQKDIAEGQIESDITENVIEELLRGDIKDTDSKETEDVSTETVCQEMNSVNEETAGMEAECAYTEATSEHSEGANKEAITQVTFSHSIETAIEDISRDYAENAYKEIDDSIQVKRRANQEGVELGMLVGLKELDGEISETPPNVQDSRYIVKESPAKENEPEPKDDGKSWHAEETGLHAPEGDTETTGLEGESSHINTGEIEAKKNNLEANIRLSEHSLEAYSHTTSIETDVDQEVSLNDGISSMDINADTGTTTDLSEHGFLDETMNKEIEEESDKARSLKATETYSIPGMLVKPIPLRPVVFSNDYSQQLDVVSEPDEPDTHIFRDGDGSLSDSHHKDVTDSAYGELSSLVKETLHLGFRIVTKEDQEQIQSVIRATRTVGPQSRIQFFKVSKDHEKPAEDEPDCYNQGFIFDTGFKSDTTLPNREPLTKPETDNILAQEAMLTVAADPILTDTTLSHEGPVVGDKGKVDSGMKSGQHAVEGVGTDSPPLLITRQRSYTDPGLSYDNTQQDDQHGEEKPRTRLRSMTPPPDNFAKSLTAISPQAILESKPLEKAQTSIVYPEIDYDISGEQKAEEATSRQAYTFAPTQIFNPLFFVQEGTEEHGFYQGKTLPRHTKEDINKRQIPSPPRDTEVLLKGQQPETISGPRRSSNSSGTTVETPATDSEAAPLLTPLWLPPRPLRHAESAGGKDFRSLKPNENPLVRRPTVRHKRSTVGSSGLRRYGAMNLPTIPQGGSPGETSFSEKSSRPDDAKVHISNTRQRPFPRQTKINEQEDREFKNKTPMERLAEIEESSGKSSRSPEAVLRRDKRSQIQPPTADTKYSIHRRYSTLINSSSLLYQEYSDVAQNQEIQRQKPGDSTAEEKDPGSPRQRRRILSSHDSYLQRLSISSADSLWQDLPKVRDSVTFISMSREEQKLQEAKFELIMSEALYLRSLNIAVDHFQHSTELQKDVRPQERQWLFSRVSEVRDVSNDFLFDLEEEFENNMYNFQVCDVVINHEPNFRKVYLPYVTNQTYQDRTFQTMMNKNPRFQQVLSKLESDPVCQRLSLKSFLILPFQRITRLRLLLQNILKRSAPGSNEELQATEAHNAIEKLIRDCNEGVQKMRDTEELIHLHQKIQFECKIFPLISASRRLVKHGEVTSLEFNPISFKWKGTTRQVYLHLFSDCLLLSRIREGGRFVVFDHGSDFHVEGCQVKMYSNQKNMFRIFLRDSAANPAREGSTEGQYIFRTETQSQKLRWIYALMPPKEEIDFMRGDLIQVQCLKSYKARENDELSLEKADILMVTQNSDDGWLCGIRLSDLHSGWFPQCHVQAISRNACIRNLQEEQRLQNARAKLHPTGAK